MIRKLATASRNGNGVVITSYNKSISCRYHSGHSIIGRPSLLARHLYRNGSETSSVQSSERAACNVVINLRTLSTFKPYEFPPWNQVPYQQNFIDGPMMPKEKEKKKKKKKKKPEKILPPMDSIEQAFEKMRIRFDEIEKEHLGPSRGIRTVKWIAGKKCEGLHKTVTTKMANSLLNSWVYCRHALMHGHYQLNDMTKKELAESILGKGTKTKIPDREARLILKELFRFGKSSYLDRYMKLHLEKMKMMGRAAVTVERNRLGVPKIRNLATVEEMAQHGYTQEEIDEELLGRIKKDENRRLKKFRKEMPAYLRHEVSGARRQEARKIERILRRKEKKRLLLEQEEEARFGPSSSSHSSVTAVRGEDDTDAEDSGCDNDSGDDSGDDSDDDDDNYSSSDEAEDSSEDLSVSDSDDNDCNDDNGDHFQSDVKIIERGNGYAVDKESEGNVLGSNSQHVDAQPAIDQRTKSELVRPM